MQLRRGIIRWRFIRRCVYLHQETRLAPLPSSLSFESYLRRWCRLRSPMPVVQPAVQGHFDHAMGSKSWQAFVFRFYRKHIWIFSRCYRFRRHAEHAICHSLLNPSRPSARQIRSRGVSHYAGNVFAYDRRGFFYDSQSFKALDKEHVRLVNCVIFTFFKQHLDFQH